MGSRIRLAHRALRKEFTLRRWGTNPYQMYCITFLLIYSVLQLMFGSSGIFEKSLNTQSFISIAICNTIGAIVAIYGLHVREFDRSIMVEAWGYLSLIGVMLYYVLLLIFTNPFPYTAYALAFGESFVLASIHRTVQIRLYFRAKKRGDALAIWAMLGQLEKDGPMP